MASDKKKATRPVCKRLALVFDFDDTLAPDSYRSLLESLDLNKDTFTQERVEPRIKEGWDPILSRFYALVEESQRRDGAITRERLEQIGKEAQFFDGVPEMFEKVRTCARDIVDDIEVEFYILSSGFQEIAAATPIADSFTQIWGCEFHFDDRGSIIFPKRVITHPEKDRYLRRISRGMLSQSEDENPADVYRDVPEKELHVPLRQMIYVGDGASDMPVFGMLGEGQGIAIGVFKSDKARDWEGYEDVYTNRRVANLAPADFGENSELMRSVLLAVESICKMIALRAMSSGE